MEKDCIFCKIINGDMPSYRIYEDEYTYAFLDISKDTIGHTLVVPKEHYVNSLDCEMSQYIKVQETVKKISEHYVNDCGYTGVNIMNASGFDAQQSVFHYHVHIIPRMAGDGLDVWPFRDKQEIDLAKVADELKF